ncbi:hypothetical protein Tco_0909476 [Tanacetum coccineum]|uniref:Xylulose kinase-1 n=1 Tax=Tanacetum coccineum TaxID=301880 RepID=A0ABQ5CQ36_9ASTR
MNEICDVNHVSKNDDTPMCECHEVNSIQSEGYQNRNSYDSYSPQSHHNPNDSEKSLTELKTFHLIFQQTCQVHKVSYYEAWSLIPYLEHNKERKARTTLLMALPEDHLAKFHKMTDAKEMWDAIKSRFGGNDESKKMQKYIRSNNLTNHCIQHMEGLQKVIQFQKSI